PAKETYLSGKRAYLLATRAYLSSWDGQNWNLRANCMRRGGMALRTCPKVESLMLPSMELAPLTMKPFADSRWPLTENNPGSSPPEGAIAPKPPPEEVLEVAPVDTGVTPVCTASKFVKLRPLSGASAIL